MTDTKAVSEWYDANAENEHDRLQHFGLEYALSLRAINQCIASIQSQQQPPRPLKILDLGGGTGRYCTSPHSLKYIVYPPRPKQPATNPQNHHHQQPLHSPPNPTS